MSIPLDAAACWNMDFHRSRKLVALGVDGFCRVYKISRTEPKSNPGKSANQRGKGNKAVKSENDRNRLDNYSFTKIAEFKTCSDNFQKAVKFSPNGQRVICGGSDGSLSCWNVDDSSKPIWRRKPYEKEVKCVDWSPDSVWISSSSHSGEALLHSAENGKLCSELHTIWNMEEGNDKYRFRALKFIPGVSDDQFGLISAHEPRICAKPPLPNVITGWQIQKKDEYYRHAIPVAKYVAPCGERISCLTVSDCGELIGVGSQDGGLTALSKKGLRLIMRSANVHDGKPVTACCFLPKLEARTPSIFSVSYDNTVKLLPIEKQTKVPPYLYILIIITLLSIILYFL